MNEQDKTNVKPDENKSTLSLDANLHLE
jgi:hypothetical protein